MAEHAGPRRRGRLATGRLPDRAPGGHRTVARQGTLREHNLSIVLERIVDAPEPVSRAGIAAATGLTRGTVSALVDRLVSAGFVAELAPVAGVGAGRPAVPLVAARGTVAALGLEINVDYLGVRVIDLGGRVLAEHVVGADFRDSSARRALGRLKTVAGRALADVVDPEGVGRAGGGRAGTTQIAGACLALPGLVDRDTGPLRIAPNLGWRDVDVLAHLAGHPLLGHDLRLANEANLAAHAEAHARRGDPASFLYVSGEVGIGAAVVLDGEVFPGRHGWSGELGHTLVATGDGSAASIESLAGQDALMRDAGLAQDAGISALLAAAHAGGKSRAALDLAGHRLGVALANAVNLLDLDHVVLGGIYAPLSPFLRAPVQDELARHVITSPWAAVQVSEARAGAFPAMTGGALSVLRSVVADPLAFGVPG